MRRETPFDDPEHQTKRSLYPIDDPFVRLWFRVVAAHRAELSASTRAERIALLRKYWPGLASAAWEELCRRCLPELDSKSALARLASWQAGARWWRGNLPEWDLVSRSADGKKLLLAEVKWSQRPFSHSELQALARAVAARPPPMLSSKDAGRRILRAVFVPGVARGAKREIEGVHIVAATELRI